MHNNLQFQIKLHKNQTRKNNLEGSEFIYKRIKSSTIFRPISPVENVQQMVIYI